MLSPSLFQTLSNKSIFQNLLKEVYFSHSLYSTLLCLLSPLPGLIFPSASDTRFILCSSPRSSHVLRCTILCKFELALENVKIVTSLWGILQLFHPQKNLCGRKELLLSVCPWTSDCCYVLSFVSLLHMCICDILTFFNLYTLFSSFLKDLKLF